MMRRFALTVFKKRINLPYFTTIVRGHGQLGFQKVLNLNERLIRVALPKYRDTLTRASPYRSFLLLHQHKFNSLTFRVAAAGGFEEKNLSRSGRKNNKSPYFGKKAGARMQQCISHPRVSFSCRLGDKRPQGLTGPPNSIVGRLDVTSSILLRRLSS